MRAFRQVFSPFGEDWLAGSHGGGITFPDEPHIISILTERWSASTVPLLSMLMTVGGHGELQAAALLKAVWWDFRLADGLVLFVFCMVTDFSAGEKARA